MRSGSMSCSPYCSSPFPHHLGLQISIMRGVAASAPSPVDTETNDVDPLAGIVLLGTFGLARRVDDAAQRERERSLLAAVCENLRLARPQFEGRGLADHDF